MNIIYEGTDITDFVAVRSCLFFDYAGDQLDLLSIEFDNARAWHGWQPKTDDRITIVDGAYSTGILYLSAVAPEDDRYKIVATSAPTAAKGKGWYSFQTRTIGEIFNICAAACGMKWELYGIDRNAPIPYIERENESCLSFLQRLMNLEGGTLKCVNGTLTGISYAFAQSLSSTQTIQILSDGQGTKYTSRPDLLKKSVTVRTPFASAVAVDSAAASVGHSTFTRLPALSDIQAARWARGLLLCNNRKADTVTMETEFNEGMTALAHISIVSDTNAAGEWLAEEVKHDFVERRTAVKLLRCIDTIR